MRDTPQGAVLQAPTDEADVLLRVIQRLNGNPYSLTKSECIHEVEQMRNAALAATPPPAAPAVPQHTRTMARAVLRQLAEPFPREEIDLDAVRTLALTLAASPSAPAVPQPLTDKAMQRLWHETAEVVPMADHHLHYGRAIVQALAAPTTNGTAPQGGPKPPAPGDDNTEGRA